MSYKENYEAYVAKREQWIQNNPLSDKWIDQERRYVHPFRLYGNIFYVGDTWVCVHLIDTGDGLLLLDAGNLGATAMLVQAIWEMGFNPADVRWVVLSHGHVDHIGGAVFFRTMFGSKILLGEPDARMFADRPWFSMIQDANILGEHLFEPDEVIRDGDVKRFGNLDIQFYLVPGHSEGCIAAFFDMEEDGVSRRVGYYGGFGFVTLTKEFLKEFGDPEYNMRRTYLESLAKVRDEKVKVYLGNHTRDNRLLEKLEVRNQNPDENPFIDPDGWRSYLDAKRDALIQFMEDPKNN